MSVPAQGPVDVPLNPFVVLAAAILLPASGHVLLRIPTRGLRFLFFMVILGWITFKLAPPQASPVGHLAGGFLIYALSILDAYKIAKVRHTTWLHALRAATPGLPLQGDQT